jgi:hypothetical protein
MVILLRGSGSESSAGDGRRFRQKKAADERGRTQIKQTKSLNDSLF